MYYSPKYYTWNWREIFLSYILKYQRLLVYHKLNLYLHFKGNFKTWYILTYKDTFVTKNNLKQCIKISLSLMQVYMELSISILDKITNHQLKKGEFLSIFFVIFFCQLQLSVLLDVFIIIKKSIRYGFNSSFKLGIQNIFFD